MKRNLLSAVVLSAFFSAHATAQVSYSTVLLESQPAPGLPGTNYSPRLTLSLANQINSKGQALVFGQTALDDGLWAGAPGATQLVALDGAPAPGTEPDVVFLVFDEFNSQTQATDYVIGSGGQVALRALLRGPVTPANNLGLWAGAPGALQLVARRGSAAPDTEADTVFSDISFETTVGLPGPALNASGQIAFTGRLTGPSVNPTNGAGIWAGAPGSIHLIARSSSPAAGLGAGFLYGNLVGNPLINDAGQVAFSGGFLKMGSLSEGGGGIWTGTPGSLQLLVRFGTAAPGIPNATLQGLNGQMAFNGWPGCISGDTGGNGRRGNQQSKSLAGRWQFASTYRACGHASSRSRPWSCLQ